MDNDNRKSDFSLDEILEQLAAEKEHKAESETPSRIWSVDEIDSLLGEKPLSSYGIYSSYDDSQAEAESVYAPTTPEEDIGVSAYEEPESIDVFSRSEAFVPEDEPAEDAFFEAVEEKPAEDVFFEAVEEKPAEDVFFEAVEEKPAEDIFFDDKPETNAAPSESAEPISEDVFVHYADDPLFSDGYLGSSAESEKLFSDEDYLKYEQSVFSSVKAVSEEPEIPEEPKISEEQAVFASTPEADGADSLNVTASGMIFDNSRFVEADEVQSDPFTPVQAPPAVEADAAQVVPSAPVQAPPVSKTELQTVDEVEAQADAIMEFFTNKPHILPSEEQDRERRNKVLQLDKTAEQELYTDFEPIEKPGVIIEPGMPSATSDLQGMPTVISADAALDASRHQEKTIVNNGRVISATPSAHEPQVPDIDGQIVLSGFGGDTPPESISEEDAEDSLMQRRKEKVRKFKLFEAIEGPEDSGEPSESDAPVSLDEVLDEIPEPEYDDAYDDEDMSYGSLEYRSPESRHSTGVALQRFRKRTTLSLLALFAVELVLIIISVVPAIFEKIEIEAGNFAADGLISLCVSTAAFAVACFVCLPCLKSGASSLFALHPNSDSAAALAVYFAFANCVVSIIGAATATQEQPRPATALYAACAVFVLIVNSLARNSAFSRILSNFKFCAFTHPNDLHAVRSVDNQKESAELGRGLLMREPDIRLSSHIKFPTRFVELSRVDDLPEKVCRILLPSVIGVSLVLFALTWVKSGNFFTAFSVLCGAVCIGVPASGMLAVNLSMSSACRKLNTEGAMISGLEAAEDCGRTNAVALDASDLFDSERCTLHGMKDFKSVRIDDVILYAAAMVIRSGGPLIKVFDDVIGGRRELLPPVKSLGYEDKLGLSAWIHGQKVFLGNRNFMINHNVEVPSKNAEMKYTLNERKVIYLAIANTLAAMFVVSYAPCDGLIPYLRSLEENGVAILVRTCDSNITEEMIAGYMGIQPGSIKVLSAFAGRVFKRNHDIVKETSDALVLHTGSALSFLKAVAASVTLSSSMRTLSIVQIVCSLLGVAAMFVLCALTGFSPVSVWAVVLFRLIETVVAVIFGAAKSSAR